MPVSASRQSSTLLESGIYLAPSAFEVGFLSAAHTRGHIEALASGLRQLL
jgi:glutamate-1-semialdehyde aminotransferase